ncbi:MAG: hypothetical protein AAGA86_08770 [Bacteroidota bacterium]
MPFQTQFRKYRMDIEEDYNRLVKEFGKENLEFEYFHGEAHDLDSLAPEEILKRMFAQIKLTHLPSNTVVFGTKSQTQLGNTVEALQKLKERLS